MVSDRADFAPTGPAVPPGVPARAFDGHSTLARAVALQFDGDTLHVHDPAGPSKAYAVAQLQVGDGTSDGRCPLRLSDGGTLWLEDVALATALRQARGSQSWVAQAIASPKAVLAALVLLVALTVWFGHSGAGLAARAVLPLVPAGIDRAIGNSAWLTLERQWLRATHHPERCQALALRFDQAVQAHAPGPGLPPVQCRRTGEAAGFNAFALPNGQIVLLDGMLDAFSDDQLMVVLGHELAHVRERHTMQALMRQMGLLAMAGAVLGDFSGAAVTALVGLRGLTYGRDAEREADAHALRFMASAGLPPKLWGEVWQGFALQEARSGGGLPLWASSHPPTEERQRLATQATPR